MTGSIDQTLRSARASAKAGRFAEARTQLLAVLRRFPANTRAMQQLQEVTEAASGLRARPFSEGHLRRILQIKDTQGPAAAIPEVVALCLLNPGHPFPHNVAGALHLDAGDPIGAQVYLTAALRLDPTYPDAAANLARAQDMAGDADAALATLKGLVTRWPKFAPGLAALAAAYDKRHATAEAVEAWRAYVAVAPKDAEAQLNLGNALSTAGRPIEAAAAFEAAIALEPANFRAKTNLGNMLLTQGRNAEALVQFEDSIALNPRRGTPFFNLSRALKFTADSPHFAQMQALVTDASLPASERMQAEYALSKAYEDIKDYDRSFAHLTKANDLRRAQLSYSTAQDTDLFARIRTRWARDSRQALPPSPERPARLPILVCGMMRSGTTLTEQIISNHSAVYGAGELDDLNHIMDKVMANPAEPDRDTLIHIRQSYLARIAAMPGDTPFVLDKMPFNFRWIGALRQALPEAPILHMRRDPMAVCWSIFKTFFTSVDIGFAYRMDELAAYYDLYADLMAFWRSEYPGGFLDVDYAALTEDPETQIRRLLEFCGLPWEDACLSPETNARAVRTASQQQVRQGIYKGSTEQWRRFESHLGPLITHFQTRAMG
jgi:tetratricopeptide (TPR) repeat protein